MNSTAQHLSDFTRREARLMDRLARLATEMPERLSNWRLWIQDSAIYLNELRNFVEDAEASPKARAVEIAESDLDRAENTGNDYLIGKAQAKLATARSL